MRAFVFLTAAFTAASCSHAQSSPAPAAPPATAATAPAASSAPGPVAAFETVRAVLQSPRCVNCHPTGDQPTQGDDSHRHLQFVQRGPEGRGAVGLACATCHGKANPPASYGAHMPPGVSTEWRLPPPQHRMVFAGLSSQALCRQLKDPKQNGGLNMAGLFHHVSSDPLVLWGWSPGEGRKPVPIAHQEFVRAFKEWADAGAPCPPEPVAHDR
jgi:hypothetical protein